MFGFRKPKPAPPLCQANPGIGAEAKATFTNGSRSWTEKVDLVSLAVAACQKRSYTVANRKTWLEHPDSGIAILPQLVEMHPLDGGAVQTVTTMQVSHPTLAPAGVFEYQHSTGNSMADSISKGFDQWLQTDFVSLLDALQPAAEHCTTLEIAFAAKDGKPRDSAAPSWGRSPMSSNSRRTPPRTTRQKSIRFAPVAC